MDHGFEVQVDERTAVLSNLHEILSLFRPCRIDDSFLHHCHNHCQYVALGISLKRQEFRLTITMIGQPKRAKDHQSIAFNTAVVVQVLNICRFIADPGHFMHSCACATLWLVGFGFLLSISLIISWIRLLMTSIGYDKRPSLLITWPTFDFVLRSEEGMQLFRISATPKNILHIATPSLTIEKNRWKVTFRTSLNFKMSINSGALDADISEMKISLTHDIILPFLKEMISVFREIITKFMSLRTGKKNCLKSAKYSGYDSSSYLYHPESNSILQSNYKINLTGNILRIKLLGDVINSSIYFKLKKYIEKGRTRENDKNNCENVKKKNIFPFNIIFSVGFSELLISDNNQNIPFCVAMAVSFFYSHVHDENYFFGNSFYRENRVHSNNRSNLKHPNNTESQSSIKSELQCSQIQLFLDLNDDNCDDNNNDDSLNSRISIVDNNSNQSNDNNKIIILNLFSSYSYSHSRFPLHSAYQNNNQINSQLRNKESSTSTSNKDDNILKISFGNLDLDISEKLVDFILDRKLMKSLHYCCFLIGKFTRNFLDFSIVHFSGDNISIELTHCKMNIDEDLIVKSDKDEKFKSFIEKKTIIKELNDLKSNYMSDIDDLVDSELSDHTIPTVLKSRICSTTIFLQKLSYKFSKNSVDFDIQSYEIYFSEQLSSCDAAIEIFSITNTNSADDLISLWSPD